MKTIIDRFTILLSIKFEYFYDNIFHPNGAKHTDSHKFFLYTFFMFITSYIYSFDMPIINFVHAGTNGSHATKG